MSDDADKYEGDETQASTASSSPGIKYYQIAVPGFEEVTTTPPSATRVTTVADGTLTVSGSSTTTIPTFSGNSFLRMGSSPDPVADWSSTTYANSVKLAKLAANPAWIETVEGIEIQSGKITSSGADDPNCSTLASAGSTSFSDNYQDGAGATALSAAGSAQDPNFLLGFADDTRFRGNGTPLARNPTQTQVNGYAADNTTKNRQAETVRLLTKGGWWDHSDGNRVTTTSGDKIEVIQGNYKLVVLGRQPLPTAPADSAAKADVTSAYSGLVGNAFITDVSGGHFQEQYPSPTPCIKTVEYVQDANGEWTLYQDNGIGNLVTKLKGRTVDLFQGASRETYVGSSDKKVLYANGYKDPNNTSAPADQTKPASSTNATASDTRVDPVLTSKTWAQSVLTQVGSEDKPIGWGGSSSYILDTSTGDPVGPAPGSASNGDVVNLTWAQRIRNYTGSPAAHVKHLYSETHADEIQTYTFGESSTTINGVLNTFELGMGVKESVALGLQASLFVGRKVDICIGPSQNFAADLTDIKGIHEVLTVEKNELNAVKTAIRYKAQVIADSVWELHMQRQDVGTTAAQLYGSFNNLAADLNLGV